MRRSHSFAVCEKIYHPMRVWHFAGPARLGYKPWIYPHTQAESYDRYALLTRSHGRAGGARA